MYPSLWISFVNATACGGAPACCIRATKHSPKLGYFEASQAECTSFMNCIPGCQTASELATSAATAKAQVKIESGHRNSQLAIGHNHCAPNSSRVGSRLA